MDDIPTKPISTTNPMGVRQRAPPPPMRALPPAPPPEVDDDEGGMSQPNEACRLLFGPNTKTAPIDAGFPTHTPFEHGELEVQVGAQGVLDLDEAQKNLGSGPQALGYAIVLAAAATGVGLFYLADKCTLVQEGEVAIVQSYDGTMRVLQRGLYLAATVGTSVRKFALSNNLIQHGLIKIIRVLPGHIGLCTKNGRPVLLKEGQHYINDALFNYVGDAALTDNQIQVGTAHIITVPSDQVGLASVASVAHFLGPGRHAFNNPVFSFVGFHNATEPHIALHSKHRIYVPRGKLALATLDVEPLMLEAGLHNYDNPRFGFKQMADATEPYLFVGSLHRLFMPAGSVALVVDEGVGSIVETTGVRFFNSATFEFKGLVVATKPFIRVGAATRVTIAAGTLGKLTINGVAQLLQPGIHSFNEQNLIFDGVASATDPVIIYGNIKRLLVPQGTWLISYNDGELVCLSSGMHTLTKPSHAVAGSLSAGMTVLALKAVRSMTADNVQLLFDAALSVRVQDPVKAVTMLCGGGYSWDSLTQTILRKADLLLNSSIGQHRFNQASAVTNTARSAPAASAPFESDKLLDTPAGLAGSGSRRNAGMPAPAAPATASTPVDDDPRQAPVEPPSFKEQIHKIFMDEFTEMMLHECGIEIISMTIEGVSIVDPDLAKEMAKGAVARAQLVAATVSNEGMKLLATAKAASMRIEAEGNAASRMIGANAEAQAKLIDADAESRRIEKVSSAMRSASDSMIQKELLQAAGGILQAMDANGSRLFVGPDPVASLMAMLSPGFLNPAGAAAAAQAQSQAQAQLLLTAGSPGGAGAAPRR